MTEIVIKYFWNILALCVSPVAGFMIGQFYKVSQDVKPTSIRIITVCAAVSGVFAFMLWPGDWSESGKIALTVGAVSPLIVWAWFAVAARFAPEQSESLRGNNGDLTVLPWVTVKKKHKDAPVREDGAPVDYDTTQPKKSIQELYNDIAAGD